MVGTGGEPEAFAAPQAANLARVPGDPADPDGFRPIAADWLEWLRDLAPHTAWAHSYWLATFAAWAELRGVTQPADVTLPVLEAYQRHVSLRRKADGTPLSWSTQLTGAGGLRAFFAWCKKTRRRALQPGRRG